MPDTYRTLVSCALAACLCLPALHVGAAEAGDALPWTPPIYKRFFDFTEYEERPATEFIVIHHTGFPGEDKDSTAADIHEFHQKTNGWAGIGYHYLIRKNGMIEQGRRPEAIGAHAYHHNKTSTLDAQPRLKCARQRNWSAGFA